jgi:hypothetical protein
MGGHENPRGADDIEISHPKEHARVEWIAKEASDNRAVNLTELLNHCITNFGMAITR